MKYLFSLGLFSALLLPVIAKADIAPDPGFHRVNSCAYFDNLSDFPTFDVYTTSSWRFGPSATPARGAENITSDIASPYGCGNTGTPFFAIKQSDQKNITHKIDDERGDFWDLLPENEQYYINATVTGQPFDFSSELIQGDMPDTNPTVNFVSVYHIDILTDTTFTAHLAREARYDASGTLISQTTNPTENQPTNQTPSTPNTTNTSATAASAIPYLILGGVIATGLVLLALAWRAMKKE